MDSKSKEFAQRLQWALERLGIVQPAEQVQKVANAAGVTLQTAKKYLSGKSRPNRLDHRYGGLANCLDVFVGWLIYGGDAPRTTQEITFLQNIKKMTDEERDKLHRAMFLLRNGSKRVQRLLDLTQTGHISPAAFLDLAGGKKG